MLKTEILYTTRGSINHHHLQSVVSADSIEGLLPIYPSSVELKLLVASG